jgi:hypothetical protein
MGLSVSRTILINDDLLEVGNQSLYTSKWEALQFLKRIPKGTHYTVTYTLDENGPILVVKKLIMIIVNIRTKEDMGACFLPKGWDGKRVRRSVKVPVYENGVKSVV